jgi:hypothetical protein
MKSYWVSTPVYTFRVDVDGNGMIRGVAAIARWSMGKNFDDVIRYFKRRFQDVHVTEL